MKSLKEKYNKSGEISITIRLGKNDKHLVEFLDWFCNDEKRSATNAVRYFIELYIDAVDNFQHTGSERIDIDYKFTPEQVVDFVEKTKK